MKQTKSIIVIAVILSLTHLISFESVYSRSLDINSKGKIKGLILDANEARVPNARVVLKGKEFTRKVKSNEAGEFEVELPAGVYQISIDARSLGFSLFQEKGIRVRAGSAQEFRITLGSIVPVIVD
ncbi:MAG: carboxypeptidase regulatory-like domain-containing protein [Pyrinomonadaceae bacterium]|nr:carboxypeptidase regulatory-like domain-containing protein [Pyrinomonadaceae bacterium]